MAYIDSPLSEAMYSEIEENVNGFLAILSRHPGKKRVKLFSSKLEMIGLVMKGHQSYELIMEIWEMMVLYADYKPEAVRSFITENLYALRDMTESADKEQE